VKHPDRLAIIPLLAAWLASGCVVTTSPSVDVGPSVTTKPRPKPVVSAEPGTPDGGETKPNPGVDPVGPGPQKPTRPSPVPSRGPLAMDCTLQRPTTGITKAGPQLGAYAGMALPQGWEYNYQSEADVTAAIALVEASEGWACFQKFFPGASSNYMRIKREGTTVRPPMPSEQPWVPRPSPTPPWVRASAAPPSGATLILSGTVYDDRGRTVDAATVSVRSLDASVPYEATVTTVSGSYVVNNVPEGANVAVTVTRDGYTTRRRIGSYARPAPGARNTVDFGGTAEDAAAYFISDHPEIASTSPAHYDRGQDSTGLSFRVELSEPLDEANMAAFERAFAIVPTSDTSSITPAGTPFPPFDVARQEGLGQSLENITAARFAYTLREGDSLLGSSVNAMRATWNARGNEVTFTFDGGLKAHDNDPAGYQAVLLAPASPIVDGEGNMLGTNARGAFSAPPAGTLLCNAFRDPDPYYDGEAGEAWAQTHTSSVPFELGVDATAPELQGVAVVSEGADLRLELTFSEPMAAYAGSGKAYVRPSVLSLYNYAFMLGARSSDIANEALDGPFFGLPGGPISTIRAAIEPGWEVMFEAQSVPSYTVARGGNLQANPTAAVAVEVEPDTPNVVNIWFRNGARDGLFAGFGAIKALALRLEDPAGNLMQDEEPLTVVGATF
jgi:hypothetical protein